MRAQHRVAEPHSSGMLAAGDGNSLYWEECGNPRGKPAVMLHGGPGSGCPPFWRSYFDPALYRAVLYDQRGCGRSTPHAGDPNVSLATNTTQHLVRDLERLREHAGVERWLVVGGSWGSTLALAYAESHPERVSEMVLFSVATTTAREVRWVTRDAGRFFPAEWRRFRDAVPEAERGGDLATAYHRILEGEDATARESAALEWCRWESRHVTRRPEAPLEARFEDPKFRMAFARLVTHYWSHAGFLDDGELLRNLDRLRSVPAVLVHGALDLSSPVDVAWEIHREWPGSTLVVVDEAGHGGGQAAMRDAIMTALDGFARRQA